AVARAAAPEPAHLWLLHQSVDPGLGRRGSVYRGPHAPAHQWRSHSPGAGTPGRPLEAGQTLDHQSRSRVPPKKKRRDRLMALAATHPTWGLGFGDEVWWSRLAQPALHSWAPDAQALRLGEKARPKTDPEPKALACYGLLMRHVPHPARREAVVVWGTPPGQYRDDRLSRLVQRAVGGARAHRRAADLGQRVVAYQPRGADLAAAPQSPRQADRAGRAHPGVPSAE